MADSLLADLPPTEQEIEFDPTKDYFAELVGEGKKFKTSADIAKKIYHADQTIELMKKRLDQDHAEILRLRNEQETKARLEDLVNQLSNSKEKLSSNNQPTVNEEKKPEVDLKQIESLVLSKIQETDSQRKAQENFESVRAKLIERFGSNYQSAVKEQIDTLGISAEDFDSMARKSPRAVLRTLGLDQQNVENFNAPPRTNKMPDIFKPRGAEKRSWAYYQNLKKTDPRKWADRSTMIQMQKDAIELGEAFRDGDYYA